MVKPIIVGEHDGKTIAQLGMCATADEVAGAVLLPDGHLGYTQPIGGVVAYRDHISPVGVGFDIACGNLAVQTDVKLRHVVDRVGTIMDDITKHISFGVGRVNGERVEHPMFDDRSKWEAGDVLELREKAVAQLGTVGSGNHYVDLMVDMTPLDDPEFDGGVYDCRVWIGIHFGSRGFGHGTATKYLKLAGQRGGDMTPPVLLHVDSEIGGRYLSAMELAGEYAYLGRQWVAKKVLGILGGREVSHVHNHHNYAWQEEHNGELLWVVRKGATPAFPGQQGFVGGSMGDDAVILEGIDSPEAATRLYSTVHGAGRVMGRKVAKATLSREEWQAWMQRRGVVVRGADLDESPAAYRRLTDVLDHCAGTVNVLHTLRPFGVAMAGNAEFDPYKD